jgi:mono/diheme cytochrome c family protein
MPGRCLPILLLLFAPPTAAWGGDAPAGAGPQGERPAARVPTFQREIRPLFEAKCLRCHGGRARKADLDLSTPAGVQKGGESGPVVVPGNPAESPLYEKVHDGDMPPGKNDRLSEAQVESIRRWIAAGAETGPAVATTTDPAVSQHDAFPILLRHCTACHGSRQAQGGLDLRTKAGMLRGGKSGPAVIPGRPEASPLLQKIRQGQMPPPDRLVEASVKPVEKAEADVLAAWIAGGAAEVATEPDAPGTTPDPLVSDSDRNFWSFRPPAAVTIPAVRHPERVRNPIDAFVLEKLGAKGLTLAPEAGRAALLRRASVDLTGLSPEPAEVQAFLRDDAPDAYERAVDRLLASPRYGERWGRFWLDLAGYADSEGKREQDLPRPHAWRYRDYVIRSFNGDKPYDRFLLEQLAGDELADHAGAPDVTEEIYDNLVATGFLRMAPDATWANITGYLADRVEVIADEIDVFGSAVLGLTLKCARCHSHKYDPIPQRDYYRLLDVFKGAYDEHDWLKPDVRPGLGPVSSDVLGGRLLPYVPAAERRRWEAEDAPLRREVEAVRSELDREAQARTARLVEERLNGLPEVLRGDLKAMLATPPEKRDAVQRYLADRFESQLRIDRDALKALDPVFRRLAEVKEKRIKTLERRRRPEPQIQALWDRGQPSPTYIYRRGDPSNPGGLVGPGVPSVLTDGKTPFEVRPPWPGAKSTGRRLALARWLTRPGHPLTARVAVNRVWKHHFGTGIVKSLGNFGRAGTPPSHPELLDWLAGEFVRRGWSLKAMHRLIMTSATYRQSSQVTPERQRADPDNTWLSRMPLTRLDAESLYDTMLLVAGRLDETPYGPADPVEARSDGLVTPTGTPRGWRRLVYVRHARKTIPTHLETFDYPPMNPNCLERRDSIVAPQALALMNSGMVHRLAGDFARRLAREAGSSPAEQVERVYLVALSRPPDDEELRVGTHALARLTGLWAGQQPAPATEDAEPASLKALTTYCHAILNSAEFLFVD